MHDVQHQHAVIDQFDESDVRQLVDHELTGTGYPVAFPNAFGERGQRFYLRNDAAFDRLGGPLAGFEIVIRGIRFP